MRPGSDEKIFPRVRKNLLTVITFWTYSHLNMDTERKHQRLVKPHSSLLAWRAAQGYTQQEAAQYLGISQSYYRKLEAHVQAPRPVILKRIAELTGVPVDELMGVAA